MADTLLKPMNENIHISDKELYQEFLTYFNNGNYRQAFSILISNPQLKKKTMSAQNLNLLTFNLLSLQQMYFSNPGKQKDIIEVSEESPQGLTDGTLWFKIIK